MCLFSLQVTENEFGRLFCLPFEAAQKVQNIGKNLLWVFWVASSSYELPALPPPPSLHAATPAKFSTAATAKINL
jgi:hypothetical protein